MNKIRKNIFGWLLVGFALSACSLSFGMDIFQAIESNDKNKVEELFKGKSEDEKRKLVNLVDKDGCMPLHWACFLGCKEIIQFLIDTGFDVNKTDKKTGETPLHKACSKGHTGAIKLLIKAGANLNIYDDEGQTPRLIAEINLNKKEYSNKKSFEIFSLYDLTQKFDNCLSNYGQYFEYNGKEDKDLQDFAEDLNKSKRHKIICEIVNKTDLIIMMNLKGERKSKLFDVKIKINN